MVKLNQPLNQNKMKEFLVGLLFTMAIVGGPFLIMYITGWLYTKIFEPEHIKDKRFVFTAGIVFCTIAVSIICAVFLIHKVGVEILKE